MKNILVFQGIDNSNIINWPEQSLPIYLSGLKNKFVVCIEYPRLRNLLLLVTLKHPLVETRKSRCIIYHSIGLLPFARSFSIFNKINHLFNYFLLKVYLKTRFRISIYDYIITFTPEFTYLKKFFVKSKLIYFVSDNYISLPGWNSKLQKHQFKLLEKKLLRTANMLVTISSSLFNKYKKLHSQVIYFPNPSSIFSKQKNNIVPSDISDLTHPIIGFIGTLYDWKIDLKLFYKLANTFRNFVFVIIGLINIKDKTKRKQFLTLNNIKYLGFKPPKEVPDYIRVFDACIIPYLINDFGKYAYPMKIHEYLSYGKPVITTQIPSIQYLADLDLIYWSTDKTKFIINLLSAINEKSDTTIRKKRIKFAHTNAWKLRINDFNKLLNKL